MNNENMKAKIKTLQREVEQVLAFLLQAPDEKEKENDLYRLPPAGESKQGYFWVKPKDADNFCNWMIYRVSRYILQKESDWSGRKFKINHPERCSFKRSKRRIDLIKPLLVSPKGQGLIRDAKEDSGLTFADIATALGKDPLKHLCEPHRYLRRTSARVALDYGLEIGLTSEEIFVLWIQDHLLKIWFKSINEWEKKQGSVPFEYKIPEGWKINGK